MPAGIKRMEEKTMVNKRFLLGILVMAMVLVLGFVLTGCDSAVEEEQKQEQEW